MFINRQQAGHLLAKKVFGALIENAPKQTHEIIVVGLPRGGVPVAAEIASICGAPLTILVSKKIGAPYQPELAIGAVVSSGIVVLNEQLTGDFRSYIEAQKSQLLKSTQALEHHWLEAAGIPKQLSMANKTVVLVDDGVATGMTTLAALHSLKAQRAAKIVLATPIISANTRERILQECDLIINLIAPHEFKAIGEFYADFHQVEDEEVIEALAWSFAEYQARAKAMSSHS